MSAGSEDQRGFEDGPVPMATGFQLWESLVWFLVPLGVLTVYLLEIKGWTGVVNYNYNSPEKDFAAFISHADGLRAGTWPGREPFYRAPLYSYLLAGMNVLVGKSLPMLAMLQATMAALAIALTATSASRLIGRLAGHVAGALFLGYGAAMYWVVLLHSTTAEMLMVSLSLFSLVLFREKPTAVRAACWGAAGAALCLIRPNFLLIGLLLFVGLAVEAWRRDGAASRMLRGLLVAAVVFLLPIGGIAVRNSLILGKVSGITTNGKITYVIANSRDSEVYNFKYPQEPPFRLMEAGFWRHQFRKGVAYWRSWEYPQNANFYLFRERSRILSALRVNHALLGALVFIGSALVLKSWRQGWPLLVLFWGYWATVVAFFICGRFRITIVPVMVVLAAFAVGEIIRLIRRKEKLKLTAIVLLALVLFVVMRPGETAIRFKDRMWALTRALHEGDLDESRRQVDYWRRFPCIQVPPGFQDDEPMFLAMLAVCINAVDQPTVAKSQLAALLKEHPNDPLVLRTGESVFRLLGDESSAAALQATRLAGFPDQAVPDCMAFIQQELGKNNDPAEVEATGGDGPQF